MPHHHQDSGGGVLTSPEVVPAIGRSNLKTVYQKARPTASAICRQADLLRTILVKTLVLVFERADSVDHYEIIILSLLDLGMEGTHPLHQ